MNGNEGDHPTEAAENGSSPQESELESRLAEAQAMAGQHRSDYLRAIAEL
jgi:hypothetical protein